MPGYLFSFKYDSDLVGSAWLQLNDAASWNPRWGWHHPNDRENLEMRGAHT